MDLGLAGRLALITGGSKGIGFASAWSLAREGCHLHLAARNETELDEAKASITRRFNVSVTVHPTDLSDGEAARTLIATCVDIDILVNNAGAIPAGDIQAVDEAGWRDAWDLKVFGYANTCRAALANMHARGTGVIVNIIGAAGERPTPGLRRGRECERRAHGNDARPRRGQPSRWDPGRGGQSRHDRNGADGRPRPNRGRGHARRPPGAGARWSTRPSRPVGPSISGIWSPSWPRICPGTRLGPLSRSTVALRRGPAGRRANTSPGPASNRWYSRQTLDVRDLMERRGM